MVLGRVMDPVTAVENLLTEAEKVTLTGQHGKAESLALIADRWLMLLAIQAEAARP